jgi:glycosyltransferase involved in cell wall biosynthesis
LFEIDAGRGIEVVASPLKPAMLVPPVFCAAMNVDYVTLLEGVISKNVRRNDPFPLAGPIADAVSWLNFSISECVFAAHSSAYAWARKIAPSSTPVREFTHAVDTDVFKPADQKESRRKLGIPDQSDIVIGFVGSFKPYHLVENLIHAIDRLDEQGVRVHGLLVGDGPERDQVLSVAEKYGLEDRITAPGFVPQEDVYKYVAASDLMYGLIDPDHWDSPMKVYEYAACARPVIIHGESETSFVNEIGAGITVNSTSPDSIAEGIGEFLSTPEEERKAMGSRGRTYVEDMPSWDDLAAAIVACANSGS